MRLSLSLLLSSWFSYVCPGTPRFCTFVTHYATIRDLSWPAAVSLIKTKQRTYSRYGLILCGWHERRPKLAWLCHYRSPPPVLPPFPSFLPSSPLGLHSSHTSSMYPTPRRDESRPQRERDDVAAHLERQANYYVALSQKNILFSFSLIGTTIFTNFFQFHYNFRYEMKNVPNESRLWSWKLKSHCFFFFFEFSHVVEQKLLDIRILTTVQRVNGWHYRNFTTALIVGRSHIWLIPKPNEKWLEWFFFVWF